ncbi:TetR/AcrR family transcriptional regulator [Nonomuraea sp. SBT364]|uniref:TetR/AcrR family transcriptional regulator n=1 Tax=Nonomuraea sp. SBT364 TaxID=1580530 RepID=UPI00066D9883|nr:TetR/AcrR family transcriptional regulator [Nonomuraea sp. SBT364]
MTPKRVDHDARREEILAAAVRVFARKGFAATRIEDVAAEAGIAKGSVYLSFDSREAILQAAFASLGAAWQDILRQARGDGGDPLDRLAVLVRSVVEVASREPELSRVLLDLWALGRGDPVAPLDMAGLYDDYRAAVAGLLAEAAGKGLVRPGAGQAEATVIVGAVEGCLLQWIIDPRLPIGDLAGSVVAVCLDGVRA